MTAPVRERRFSAVARSRVLLVIVLGLVLQLTLSAGIRIEDVHPDLMLLVAVCGGLAGGEERGAMVGFAAGLANDLFLQSPIGLSALTFTLVGFGVGLLHAAVLRSPWWLAGGAAVLASFGGEVLYALIGAGVGQSQMLTDRLGVVAGIVAGLNGLGALVAMPILRWAIFPDESGTRRRSRW